MKSISISGAAKPHQALMDEFFSWYAKGQLTPDDINIYLQKIKKAGYVFSGTDNKNIDSIFKSLLATKDRYNFISSLDGDSSGVSKNDMKKFLSLDGNPEHSYIDNNVLDASISLWNQNKKELMKTNWFKNETAGRVFLTNFAKNYLDLKNGIVDENLDWNNRELKDADFKGIAVDKTNINPDKLHFIVSENGKAVDYFVDPNGNIALTNGRSVNENMKALKDKIQVSKQIVEKYIADRVAGKIKLNGYQEKFKFDYKKIAEVFNSQKETGIIIKSGIQKKHGGQACYDDNDGKIYFDSEAVACLSPEELATMLMHETVHAYQFNEKDYFDRSVKIKGNPFTEISNDRELTAFEQSFIFLYTYKDTDHLLTQDDKIKVKTNAENSLKNYE